MAATILARATPYRPSLRANERVCTRCGIVFRTHAARPLTECRDCR